MPTHPLTPRQKEILDLIGRSVEAHGYPPTQREIAGHFGFSGTRAVEKHLKSLIEKGYLRKGVGRRTWEITGGFPKRRAAEKNYAGRVVPILGRVAAGRPILAEENVLGSMMIDSSIARWRDAYLLKIKGESMNGAGILDGDLVLVRPQADAESGEIVVAMVEDEATVKRLIKKQGSILLQPENPAFEPISINRRFPAKIIGKVAGVFRI